MTDKFDELLNAFLNHLSDRKEYSECVEWAGREVDYYCHRQAQSVEESKAALKAAFDSYVKSLSSKE